MNIFNLSPVVSVSLPYYAIYVGEGDGTFVVCATLSGAAVATERDFMITLATSNGTALDYHQIFSSDVLLAAAGSDFDHIRMVLTFTSGASDGDTECLNSTILDDDALEADQNFSVILTEQDDDVETVTIMTIVTITDNDSKLGL